jgi:hypothetical protein
MSEEQLLRRNVKRFCGELVLKALRLLYHLNVGSRVIKKEKKISEDVPKRAGPEVP